MSLTMRARGCDISSVQARVDFVALAAGGIDFVIPKMTQGASITDPNFASSVTKARAAGLIVPFGYHFQTVTSSIVDQAERAIGAARDSGVTCIAIDLEYPPPEQWIPPVTGASILWNAREFSERVLNAGMKLVLYTYPYFAKSLPKDANLVALSMIADLWIASYGNQKLWPPEDEEPTVPAPWTTWLFRQTSGDGGSPLPGIPQVVDHDIFNGTRAELVAMYGATP